MAIYRHKQQRRWHLVRHGPWHLVRHLRQAHHSHHRSLVSPEVQHQQHVVAATVAAICLLIALLILVVLSVSPLVHAQHELDTAKGIITTDLSNKALLTSPAGRTQLENDLGSISADAAAAQQSLSGSAPLRILGVLPVVGTQRKGVLQLATDVEQAAATGTTMLSALDRLVATSHGTTVSLPALASLERHVVEGHRTMGTLNRSSGGLIGPVATARAAFDREDAKLERLLSLTTRTIAFARPFLGAGGPQTYLIGGMNNAEIRDSGAVLSLDVLTAKDGTFSIKHDATYGDYLLSTPAKVALPAGTQKIFGAYLPTLNWPAVDATADFVTTGKSMQAMFAQATGQQVNGVIGIDVPGVISLLKLTGPVLVPGIDVPVSAANAADLLLNQEYIGDPINSIQDARRDKIAATVKAAVDQMKKERIDLDSFANALAGDVQGRHLMVWSDSPASESGLKVLDAAGTLTTVDPQRTIHVAVENSSADKLDYFLGVKVKLQVTVDPSGNALVNTTIEVANGALPNQPPSTQYGPDGVNAFTPGQYVARIFFWGPKSSETPNSTMESGLELAQSHFSLLPQQHNEVTFATVIPHAVVDGHLQLRLIPQARLAPDHLTVELSAPSWHISGATHREISWGHTLQLQWGLSR